MAETAPTVRRLITATEATLPRVHTVPRRVAGVARRLIRIQHRAAPEAAALIAAEAGTVAAAAMVAAVVTTKLKT